MAFIQIALKYFCRYCIHWLTQVLKPSHVGPLNLWDQNWLSRSEHVAQHLMPWARTMLTIMINTSQLKPDGYAFRSRLRHCRWDLQESRGICANIFDADCQHVNVFGWNVITLIRDNWLNSSVQGACGYIAKELIPIFDLILWSTKNGNIAALLLYMCIKWI